MTSSPSTSFDRFSNTRATETSDFLPSGYVPGRTRFICITGGVMSGIGKGVFAGSLCSLLSSCGLTVEPVKMEGYLNLDSGTINPERHGEVFVLDDGTECDLDLGSYERFLDRNLTRDNFHTAGKIFQSLLERERRGDFLGRDLQIIPHLTGEIKRVLRQAALIHNADVVLVEVGGTVGDLESANYLEALRELALEEGRNNFMFCHVTPVLVDRKGEQKTKPTQHSVRQLLEAGIQPDLIVLRTDILVDESTREKVALFCNVPPDQVVSSVDTPSIYTVPYALKQQGIVRVVAKVLGLEITDDPHAIPLEEYVSVLRNPPPDEIVIGVCGKYSHGAESYLSLAKALEHCEPALHCRIRIQWIASEQFESDPGRTAGVIGALDGLIVPGGFGRRGVEGMILAIRQAREQNLPYLGICLGCQLAVIEFARNVCGLTAANSTEFEPGGPEPVISLLEEQRQLTTVGGNMRLGGADVRLTAPSKAFTAYGAPLVRERFRHRYEFDRRYEATLAARGLRVVGTTPDGDIAQIIELQSHPYFVGAQYHPELLSRPQRPHPLFLHLCKQARRHRYPAPEGSPRSASELGVATPTVRH